MNSDNDCFCVDETRQTNHNNEHLPGRTIVSSSRTDSAYVANNTPLQIKQFSKLLVCLGDQSKFRMVARLHPAPGMMVETIASKFEKAVYSRRMNAALIKMQNTVITIYASGAVTMTRLGDADQAREILADVIGRINKSSEDADAKLLCDQRGPALQIDPMEVTFHLPRTNCMQCGVKSCFYFSILLACSETTLEKCKPLQEKRYLANREALSRIINSVQGTG
jgi:ArsR family metal-binding transcriptional regulator